MAGKYAMLLAALLMTLSPQKVHKDMAFPAGIRINNPGNIRQTRDVWEGSTRLQDHKTFVRFNTPECGIRAMMKLLINYEDKYKLNSITDIIMRYAPPSENDTHAYIKDVAWRTGFYPSEVLDLRDITTLIALAKAITIHEQGPGHGPYPPAWYEEVVYHRAAVMVLKERECAA